MLLNRFLHHLASLDLPPQSRAIVAVSGGADSVALLDLLVQTRGEHRLDLTVGHLDHGIHPASAEVAATVEFLAQGYGLRCITGHLALGEAASETEARTRRYAWLEETASRDGFDWILTAHHADDQVETVLLRALHGSGPAGLAAMAPRRGRIIRPLLPFRRDELVGYLRERKLSCWDDPANSDPKHERSWIRASLLPFLRQRFPHADQGLLDVAAQAGLDRQAWDQVIDRLPGLGWRGEEKGGSVAAAVLAGYDSILGNAVVRAMARRAGCRLGPNHAARAFDFLQRAESGSRCELGNGWVLEIVFDRAVLQQIEPGRDSRVGPELVLSGDHGTTAMGGWRFSWRSDVAPDRQVRDGATAWFIPGELRVRGWQAGDRVRPLGGRGSRLIVKCFQESQVPRRQRDGWPVVVNSAGAIVWIPGVCRAQYQVPLVGAEALRVDAAHS